jgi:hypothetical protein
MFEISSVRASVPSGPRHWNQFNALGQLPPPLNDKRNFGFCPVLMPFRDSSVATWSEVFLTVNVKNAAEM